MLDKKTGERIDPVLCRRRGCPNPSRWSPTLVFYPLIRPPGCAPAKLPLDLPVCDQHKNETKREHLLSTHGRILVSALFEAQNLATPDLENFLVEWTPWG